MERNIETRLTTGLQRVTLFFYFISESVIYFMKLIFWYIMERKHAVGKFQNQRKKSEGKSLQQKVGERLQLMSKCQ